MRTPLSASTPSFNAKGKCWQYSGKGRPQRGGDRVGRREAGSIQSETALAGGAAEVEDRVGRGRGGHFVKHFVEDSQHFQAARRDPFVPALFVLRLLEFDGGWEGKSGAQIGKNSRHGTDPLNYGVGACCQIARSSRTTPTLIFNSSSQSELKAAISVACAVGVAPNGQSASRFSAWPGRSALRGSRGVRQTATERA